MQKPEMGKPAPAQDEAGGAKAQMGKQSDKMAAKTSDKDTAAPEPKAAPKPPPEKPAPKVRLCSRAESLD